MNKKNNGNILIIIGLVLLAVALALAVFNICSDYAAGRKSDDVLKELEPEIGEQTEVLPAYVLNPEMEMPVITIDGKGYIGTIFIPGLGIELPVMSEWSYPNLRIAPCRYKGSAYNGSLIICAHNYERHFGMIKTLTPGDEVVFTDTDGNVFSYKVAEVGILNPYDSKEMQSGDWDLTLFTCTIGGRTRVTVRCVAA